MCTLFLTIVSLFSICGLPLETKAKQSPSEMTKEQKIEQLFELENDRTTFIEMHRPLLISAETDSEEAKEEIINKLFDSLKENYVTAYKKILDDSQVDEMLAYYESTIGQRAVKATKEIGIGMQKAFKNIMGSIEDLLHTTQKNVKESVSSAKTKAQKTETKAQKIEQLFGLTNNKETLTKVYESLLNSAGVKYQKAEKEKIIKALFDNLKEQYTRIYDKTFNESQIDEMLKHHESDLGKRARKAAKEIGKSMQKAYKNVMDGMKGALNSAKEKVGDIVGKIENVFKGSPIVHFEKAIQGKSSAEIRDLFNKEIQHNGITVVRFSSAQENESSKIYETIFDAVAEQLKDIEINNKKLSVKYLIINIDEIPVIAKDCSITDSSLPIILVYKNGARIGKKTGALKKADDLIAYIKKSATSLLS